MNRREFLAGSAAIAALSTVSTTTAQAVKRLKVLIPPTSSEVLAELNEVAPGVEMLLNIVDKKVGY